MTAKCTHCGQHWNVSILQAIPRSGYTCPRCDARAEARRRAKEVRDRLVSKGILKIF